MKGRKDQSLSAAGSVPSSTPNQLSISGPLPNFSSRLYLNSEIIPGVVKAHDADNGRKAALDHHCSALGSKKGPAASGNGFMNRA